MRSSGYVVADGWMDWRTDWRMDRCMDRWMDGRTGGWMDGLTDGWMDETLLFSYELNLHLFMRLCCYFTTSSLQPNNVFQFSTNFQKTHESFPAAFGSKLTISRNRFNIFPSEHWYFDRFVFKLCKRILFTCIFASKIF